MEVSVWRTGHGLSGSPDCAENPLARVTALSVGRTCWKAVANWRTKKKMGVADRHTALPGSAFTVEFGGPYDVVLMT